MSAPWGLPSRDRAPARERMSRARQAWLFVAAVLLCGGVFYVVLSAIAGALVTVISLMALLIVGAVAGGVWLEVRGR